MSMREVNDDDLMTVQRFAEMYRVDASVVRRWVKEGRTDYELVGPRKLRRVRVSSVVKTIEPRVSANKRALVDFFITEGMDAQDARDIVSSMDDESVAQQLSEIGAQDEQQRTEAGGPGGGSGEPTPGAGGASAGSSQTGRAKGDTKPARPATKDTKGKGRSGRTA